MNMNLQKRAHTHDGICPLSLHQPQFTGDCDVLAHPRFPLNLFDWAPRRDCDLLWTFFIFTFLFFHSYSRNIVQGARQGDPGSLVVVARRMPVDFHDGETRRSHPRCARSRRTNDLCLGHAHRRVVHDCAHPWVGLGPFCVANGVATSLLAMNLVHVSSPIGRRRCNPLLSPSPSLPIRLRLPLIRVATDKGSWTLLADYEMGFWLNCLSVWDRTRSSVVVALQRSH